jgi:phosphatidylethanolamine-binding protein (PEBP) family uncharacterized protein
LGSIQHPERRPQSCRRRRQPGRGDDDPGGERLRQNGYGGACPPKGHGPHRYRFKLLALDTDKLDLPAGSKIEQVETAATKHLLGRAELTGTYERK